jgi:hypothetical protein
MSVTKLAGGPTRDDRGYPVFVAFVGKDFSVSLIAMPAP